MKDSYGSAFSLGLFAFFFVVFVCFIAIALKFAQTYRVKNNVINILEQYEYDGGNLDTGLVTKLDNYLTSVPYNYDETYVKNRCNQLSDVNVVHHGVCIVPVPQSNPEYFRVEVYFGASFPLIGLDEILVFPISGETTSIVSRP